MNIYLLLAYTSRFMKMAQRYFQGKLIIWPCAETRRSLVHLVLVVAYIRTDSRMHVDSPITEIFSPSIGMKNLLMQEIELVVKIGEERNAIQYIWEERMVFKGICYTGKVLKIFIQILNGSKGIITITGRQQAVQFKSKFNQMG